MGDAAAQLVDEDSFVIPASWGKSIHPRRGGVPGPALKTTGDPEVIDRLKAYAQEAVHHPRSDAEIAGPARAYLTGADVTPLGAGVVAAAALITLFEGLGEYEFASATRLADALVHEHGVPFAAAATVHAVGVAFRQGQYLVRRADRYLSPPLEAMAQRVRAHLAAAPDEPYAQAVRALADLRGGPTVQRIIAAYLVPDQVAWVDELCAELAVAGTRVTEPQVLCALSTAEQLDRIADLVHPWVLVSSGVAMTLAEAVGPAAATALMRWFDDVDADGRRRLLAVVAHLPSDEAVRALIDRMDQKFVAPVLGEMLRRYPRRAVRVLGEASGGSSAKARAAAELLRRHVLAYPDAVTAVAPTLPPAVRARVESAVASTARVREADPATLPSLLVTPPWTVKRTAPKPVVVAGLRPTIERGMAWAPGERQQWATPRGWRIPDPTWKKLAQRPVENLPPQIPRAGAGLRARELRAATAGHVAALGDPPHQALDPGHRGSVRIRRGPVGGARGPDVPRGPRLGAAPLRLRRYRAADGGMAGPVQIGPRGGAGLADPPPAGGGAGPDPGRARQTGPRPARGRGGAAGHCDRRPSCDGSRGRGDVRRAGRRRD
jgi:hypothetical protein